MSEQNRSESNVIEFITWLTDRPSIQSALCNDDSEVTPEEFLDIARELQAGGFYEMIYILLMKNRYSLVIDRAVSALLTELVAREWERAGANRMFSLLMGHVRRESARKKAQGTP